ncbi:hypothetical protein MXB_339 [Myxobolus squamalis]|nr:hypothetical protein MXB_339 [Myxobolus squamalis]
MLLNTFVDISLNKVYPIFLTCESASCLPGLKVVYSSVDPKMLVGTTNKRKIEIRMTHIGNIDSYFTRLEIQAPHFSKIMDTKFNSINPNNTVHNTFENKTTRTNHFFYTIQRLMTLNDQITCEVDIEISPPIGSESFDIKLVVDDPMYKHFKTSIHSIPFFLPSESNIGFSGESFPPTIVVIGNRNDSSMPNKEDLLYILKINNIFSEESLKNVNVLLKIPTLYSNVAILSLIQIIYPPSFLPTDCSAINTRACDENTVALFTSKIDPSGIAEITVQLRLLDTFDILFDKNEKYLKLDATIYFDGIRGQLKQEISVRTYLSYPLKQDIGKLIWPIAVAVICAVIILSTLGQQMKALGKT